MSKYPPCSSIARIKLAENGALFLNGTPTSFEHLKQNFEQLKPINGCVRIFRENPHSEVMPQHKAVMQAIVDADLPVTICGSEEELNEVNR